VKRIIYRGFVGKHISYIVIDLYYICALFIESRVFASDSLGEIVFRPHIATFHIAHPCRAKLLSDLIHVDRKDGFERNMGRSVQDLYPDYFSIIPKIQD